MRAGRMLLSGACNEHPALATCRRRYMNSLCASYGLSLRKSSAGGAPLPPTVGLSAPTFPPDAASLLHFLPRRATRWGFGPGTFFNGRVIRARRISLRRQAAKHATEGGANASPSVCVSSFRHVRKHGASDARVSAQAFRVQGEVCRDRGC